MKLTVLKTETAILARLPEEFSATEVVFKEQALQSITLRDSTNKIVLVIHYSSYCMEALAPAPPKLVKKWKLAGVYLGIDICETRDTEYEAQTRKEELAAAWALPVGDFPLETSEVEVPEEEI